MKLKVFQNSVGCFNWANQSEKTFEFAMALVDDQGKMIEEDGIQAIIKFSGDPDEKDDFINPTKNLYWIFDRCVEYSMKIWSTTDYFAQCMLFAKIYQENLDDMDEVAVKAHREETERKIKELQKELEKNYLLPDISDSLNSALDSKISKLRKNLAAQEFKIAELKEDSESYKKENDRLNAIAAEIDKYTSYYIVEPFKKLRFTLLINS